MPTPQPNAEETLYALSGFITMNAMVNNIPGVDSPIGELTNKASTFSRELGFYRNATFPDVKLVTFSSLLDDEKVKVDPDYVEATLRLGQYLFQRSVNGNLSDDRENCRQQLISEFEDDYEILLVGQMATNGTYWLPERVYVKVKGRPEDNVLRLWFSDPAFRAQYDLYEIVVIPPVEPLDDLHGFRANVLSLLQNIAIPAHLKKVDELTRNHPYTHLVSTNYDWTDKNDPTITQPTPWTVAIYGNAGNNADIIRETLIDYILGNSNYDREEWEKIYPDLFLPNEFYITPIWNRYSLPNLQTQAGLYSPTVPYSEMMSYGVSTFFEQPEQHIRDYMTASASNYKALAFLAVGNHRNRSGIFSFAELWPNYVSISTTNLDFNRIPPLTQEFILMLISMFVAAENIDEYGEIPSGMSRVKRGDNWYLVQTYESVQYLVSMKSNEIFDFVEPPVDPDEPEPEDSFTIDVIEDQGILGHLYRIGGTQADPEYIPATDYDGEISWYAQWFDESDDLVREVTITNGDAEQLLFTETATETARIEITAQFGGKVVEYSHVITVNNA